MKAVFDGKFGHHGACPNCGEIGGWGRVKGTKKYFHTCRRQISPLKDTAFYRSNLSLTACFYTIFLFSNCSSGVASSFIRKQLGLGPKSSHRLCNRVRLHMATYQRPSLLGGRGKRVEVDEVFLRHVRNPGMTSHQNSCVVGIASEGKVIAGIANDRTRKTLHTIIKKYVRPKSIIVTDDWKPYRGLEEYDFKHKIVNHSKGFFNENGYSTCEIDSYWATLRRTLRSYHQFAPNNLWLFLAETEARYNFRHDRIAFFEDLVSKWPSINQHNIHQFRSRYDWRD
ncbi:MAG: IS1595 family transposase [Erythrobacter sp.]